MNLSIEKDNITKDLFRDDTKHTKRRKPKGSRDEIYKVLDE